MRKIIITAIIFFLLGLAIHDFSTAKEPVSQAAAIDRATSFAVFDPVSELSRDKASPADHLKQSQIHVYDGKVVIDADVEWSKFTDTKSMDPLFDSAANGLEITPKSENEIKIGDIISYKFNDMLIVHRVIAIGKDSQGTFYTVKGDNNKNQDDVKVRFKDVTGILVGILY